ncbi:MAG: porin family protein [Paracoccaceae bacterium]
MNMLTKAALGAVLSGAIAAPALAGGLAEPMTEAPVMVPAAPVAPSADWTGGYIGAQLGYADVNASGPGGDGDGAIYGIRAGYDWDFGNWVLGAGASWDASDIKLGGGPEKLDSVARLGLRVGADLGRTLVYATAGGARADVKNVGSDNGWYGGIGMDYALTDQWTVGGEILSHQFDNFNGTATDIDATTASVNVGFRF